MLLTDDELMIHQSREYVPRRLMFFGKGDAPPSSSLITFLDEKGETPDLVVSWMTCQTAVGGILLSESSRLKLKSVATVVSPRVSHLHNYGQEVRLSWGWFHYNGRFKYFYHLTHKQKS